MRESRLEEITDTGLTPPEGPACPLLDVRGGERVVAQVVVLLAGVLRQVEHLVGVDRLWEGLCPVVEVLHGVTVASGGHINSYPLCVATEVLVVWTHQHD